MDMYEKPGKVLFLFGDKHKVIEELTPVHKFSVCGPDITGRYCRMSRHISMYDACNAAEAFSKQDGRIP